MSEPFSLNEALEFGVQTINRRTEPAVGPWRPSPQSARELIELVDRCGYDSIWVGDHIAFAIPILDPLMQLMQAAIWSSRLKLGTGVYLLPLRHPTPVAKQVATLDLLSEGRVIFGVGIGGEFPNEFAACGVDVKERGARLTEGMQVLRKLWSGEKVANDGRFFPFPEVQMLPIPTQVGGPPMWCGGRSDAALRRAGELADGFMSYVVTPEMFSAALKKIARAAEHAGRVITSFGTSHLLFARIDHTYEAGVEKASESLSVRYAMDFRRATERYAACGRPEDVAERIMAFYRAGVRHIVMDFVGPYEEKNDQVEWFAREVKPLLSEAA